MLTPALNRAPTTSLPLLGAPLECHAARLAGPLHSDAPFMQRDVFGARQHNKILGTVVVADAVQMVDVFARQEGSAEDFLSNQAMLGNPATVAVSDSNISVSVVRSTRLAERHPAGISAETPLTLARQVGKGSAAMLTDTTHPEGSRKLHPPSISTSRTFVYAPKTVDKIKAATAQNAEVGAAPPVTP